MNFLIAFSVNLAGMLLIYSLLAYALARLSWHHGGIVPVLATIVVAGQFWIGPTLLIRDSSGASLASFSVLFCNWLISGFSVIVLSQAVRSIPRQLADSARLDGCGWFGTYWHVILPFVRRELWLIGFLTLTGTSILLIGLLSMWSDSGIGLVPGIGFMMLPSLVVTLLVIAVFLFAKGPLLKTREAAG